MTRNALDEVFGGSADFALSSGTVRMGLPHSEGGRQLYVVRPSAGGCTVTLPIAVFLPKPSHYVVVNLGSQSIDVIYSIIGTTLGTIPAGYQAEIYLLNDASPWGTWQLRLATVTEGTLLAERVAINLEFGAGAFGPVDLRRMAIDQGFTAEVAYAVSCTIRSGALIGSDSTSTPALQTGTWPTGSTLLLSIEEGAIVSGKGGAGGRGGNLIPSPGTTATAGESAGPAIRTEIATTITNRGRIQGGGGGGAGSAAFGGGAGAGGGSGAGWTRSPGGQGGFGGNAGSDGTVFIGGAGGALSGGGVPGGKGGNPGNAGQTTTLSSGSAGRGIIRYTGVPFTYLAPGGATGAPYLFGGTQVL